MGRKGEREKEIERGWKCGLHRGYISVKHFWGQSCDDVRHFINLQIMIIVSNNKFEKSYKLTKV